MSAERRGKLICLGIATIDNRGIATMDIADIKIVRTDDTFVIVSPLSRESPNPGESILHVVLLWNLTESLSFHRAITAWFFGITRQIS